MTGSGRMLNHLLEALERRHPAALVTVVRAEGTLANALGQRAVIWELGQHVEVRGSLGLGDLEQSVLDAAWDVLETRRSELIPLEAEGGRVELFVEVQHRPPTLLIAGAGHIAIPLAQLGKMCDFDVVVLDDRSSFANPGRFPTADRVIAASFEVTLRNWSLDEDTFIVLITRGHRHDVACLLEVLERPSAYIGMIGSRRRIRAVFQLLEEERGIPREAFERVHAPIGLDIGSETPAEIALSIMAEMVKVRRGGTGLSLSEG